MMQGYDVLKQRVEELDGSRRQGNRGRAAVRLADLGPLLRLTEGSSEADVRNALLAVAAALRGGLGR